jgi:hypothetical protein
VKTQLGRGSREYCSRVCRLGKHHPKIASASLHSENTFPQKSRSAEFSHSLSALCEFAHRKFCGCSESPVRRAAPRHDGRQFNVRLEPFKLVGARSFGRIAAMRLTAARSTSQMASSDVRSRNLTVWKQRRKLV